MIVFLKQETEDTPKVHLDKERDIFEISGLAVPEDAISFCRPIINWIEDYLLNPNKKTNFHFKLEYFNTAFSSQIINILMLLEKLNKKSDVTVYWHYKDIDEDMQDLGKKYSEIIDVSFKMMVYS